LIEINNEIKVNFIDINSSVIEPKENYLKYKVQLYQFPKLILSYFKRYSIYILAVTTFIVFYNLSRRGRGAS